MKNSIKKCLLALALLTTAGGLFGQKADAGLKKISADELMQTVQFLSSPELAGRKPGSDGYYQAADFMANSFFDLGLKNIVDDFFFQHLLVEYMDINTTPVFQLLKSGKVNYKAKLGSDFVCRGSTGFGDITAPLVFCGYGISEPEAGYDDYAGMDVKDKIVIVFKQNPPFKIGDIDFSNKYNRYRSNVAAEHGARGLILVSTPLSKNPQKPIGSIMDGEGSYLPDMPQMHISLDLADMIFKGLPTTLKELQAKIDSLGRPSSLTLNLDAHIKIEGNFDLAKKSMNVVGLLEGSDSVKKKEYIVVSAHLDHVGKQGDSLYFPGANDNASGSAAVLQLARAFSSQKEKPERSILFVLYSSEEQGLVGSEWFAEHCPVPVEQIVAAYNMDCIAYGDSIQVGNGLSCPTLWNTARAMDSLYIHRMVKRTWEGGGADLTPLHKLGVPGLYFVTTNSYEHLHLPSDKAETLNRSLYTDLVKLVYLVIRETSYGPRPQK